MMRAKGSFGLVKFLFFLATLGSVCAFHIDYAKYLPDGLSSLPGSSRREQDMSPSVLRANFDAEQFKTTEPVLVNKASPELSKVLGKSELQSESLSDANSTASAPTNPGQQAFSQISPSNAIVGLVLIVSGLFLTFAGRSVFKAVLFIAGFYLFAITAFSITASLEAKGTISLGAHHDLILAVICLLAGLVGGSVFQCIWKLGVYVIGALLGLALPAMLLQFPFAAYLQTSPIRYILFIAAAIVGAILVHLIEKPVLVVGTSIIGSVAFFVGLDVLLKTGFGASMYNAFVYDAIELPTSLGQYLILGGVVLLAITGMIAQFHNRRNGLPSIPVDSMERGKSKS